MSAVILIMELARKRKLERENPRISRRRLRDEENPFEKTTENYFVALCFDLIEEIEPFLKESSRSHSIPSHVKTLAALRFFVTHSFQRAVGQDYFSSLSQTSVSRCVTEVFLALYKIAHHYVKFPSRTEFAAYKVQFYAEHGFPGIIGLIDGNHVKICAPKKEIEHVYYCRKGGHSKNVQIICDANYTILSASARFGGETVKLIVPLNSFIEKVKMIAGFLVIVDTHYNRG